MNNKLSVLIKEQLPAFVVEEYPLFVDFLETYYRWLEEDGNYYSNIDNIIDDLTVDKATESKLEEMKSLVGNHLPEVLVDNKILIPNLRKFYQSKGSKESFSFLLRMMFNIDSSIDEPRRDMFKCSTGIFTKHYGMLINTTQELSDIINQSLSGKYEAYIDNAIQISTGIVCIFFSTIKETIETDLDIDGIAVTINPCISDIEFDNVSGYVENDVVDNFIVKETSFGPIEDYTIVSGGTGYSFGDTLSISGDGVVRVVGVTGGAITKLKIEAGGRYNIIPTLSSESANITFSGSLIGCIRKVQQISITDYVVSSISGVTNISGDYAEVNENYLGDESGFLSVDNVLPDRHYYQNHSYVINSEKAFSEYRTALNNLIHPVGKRVYGSVNTNLTIAEISTSGYTASTITTTELGFLSLDELFNMEI